MLFLSVQVVFVRACVCVFKIINNFSMLSVFGCMNIQEGNPTIRFQYDLICIRFISIASHRAYGMTEVVYNFNFFC